MRGIDKSVDVTKLSHSDVVQWLQSSDDQGLRELAIELSKRWGNEGHSADFSEIELPLVDLLTVLLSTCKLIEFDPRTGRFKRFERGTNATIALILFGSKLNTGGAYNAKIQEIKQGLLKTWEILATTELQQLENTAKGA